MSDHHSSDGSVQRGIILHGQGRYREAEDFFKLSLQSNPRHVPSLYLLAACQASQDGKESTALKTVDHAISIDPTDSDLFSLRACILLELRRNKEAQHDADEAVRLDPYSLQAWIAKASCAGALEDWVAGEKAARQALEIDPDSSTASNQLAEFLRVQGKMEDSRAHVFSQLARDPENAETHATAGWSLLQGGDPKGSTVHFFEALRIDPNLERARTGMLTAFRARSILYRGYLRWAFWMASFSPGARWGIIIGIMVLMNSVKFLRFTPLGPAVPVIMLALLTVVFWTHVASPIGNFLLLWDRFARYALRPREKLEAVFSGGSFLAGLALFILNIWTHTPYVGIIGMTLACGSIPFAYTFTNDSRLGPWVFGSIGAFAWVAGIASYLDLLFWDLPDRSWPQMLAGTSFLLVLLSTWLPGSKTLNR